MLDDSPLRLLRQGADAVEQAVQPVDVAELRAGDIVLCKVRGAEYLHLVKALQGGRFQIGNNRGGTNGWVGARPQGPA